MMLKIKRKLKEKDLWEEYVAMEEMKSRMQREVL